LPFRCIDMIMIIIKLQSVVNNVKIVWDAGQVARIT
jgi:hypothetical protein